MNALLPSAALLLVLIPAVGLAVRIVRGVGAPDRRLLAAWIACAGLGAVLLLRPHEDTFTALDHSGYRLMAQAFREGRPFRQPDRVLLAAPREIRNAFLLLPKMTERNTRDRSFLVRSLDTCETEPFFYPLLPLCAAGLDAAGPRGGLDFFVPWMGLLAFAALAAACASRGGAGGLLAAAALFAGSPLPLWLFRGFHAEAAGGALLALAALAWTARVGRGIGLPALAAGLAVSFHPVLAVLALPLFLLLLSTARDLRDGAAGAALFAAGVVPLLLMTAFVCTPYGDLQPASLLSNFRVSASHRIALAAGAAGLLALPVAMWMALRLRRGTAMEMWARREPAIAGTLLVPAFLPLVAAAALWSQHEAVQRGLLELAGGIRWPYGLLLLAGAATAFAGRSFARERWLLLVVLAALPVFVYLKGAEQMGLWSQRRLLAPLLLALVALSAPLASWFARRRDREPLPLAARAALAGLVAAAGLANAGRWPAPYLLRQDRGAGDWVTAVRADIAGRTAFFDYLPHSLPFAVDGRSPVYGLCERRHKDLPDVMAWMRTLAATGGVVCATSYAPPGLEEGVALDVVAVRSNALPRIRSRGALPAEGGMSRSELVLQVMRPLAPGDAAPALHKVFDGGPLALRGRWGRADLDIRGPSGDRMPAQWSREGSAVIGPVPPPGGAVLFRVAGDAARRDGRTRQVLRITPPWGGPPVELAFTNGYNEVEARLGRPAGAAGGVDTAGAYVLTSTEPYDPSAAGIRGFETDLGVLVHAVDAAVAGAEAGSHGR